MKTIKNIPQILILGLTCLLSFSSASRFEWGKCPTRPLKANFDPSLYAGSWYEISRGSDIPFEQGTICSKLRYTLKPNGNIDVYNWGVQPDGKINDVHGYATFDGAVGKVYFFYFPGDYEVVDTDYTNYAIVSSCTPHLFGLFHYQTMWILGRSNTFDDSTQRTYIDSLGFYSTSRMIYTTQGA